MTFRIPYVRKFLLLTTIAWVLALDGCKGRADTKPTSGVGGHVTVDITQYHLTADIARPGETHNLLIVLAESGAVTQVGQRDGWGSVRIASKSGEVKCTERPTTTSPDGRFMATCAKAYPNPLNFQDEFALSSANSHAILFRRIMPGKVWGFLWAPDSGGVAVLSSIVHGSWNPRFWFRALSGHPKPFETYYLHVINLRTLDDSTIELPLRGSSSEGALISWEK